MKVFLINCCLMCLLLSSGCRNAKSVAEEPSVTKSENKGGISSEPIGKAKVQKGESNPEEPIEHMDGAPEEYKMDESKYTPKIPKDLFFGMYRSACFGQCPVYNLDIKINGHAVLEGKEFFDLKGFYEAQLSESQLDQIAAWAKQYGYFEMNHVYDGPVSDLPSTLTILRQEEGVHWVYDRIGAPEALHMFEREVEVMIKDIQWKAMNTDQEK